MSQIRISFSLKKKIFWRQNLCLFDVVVNADEPVQLVGLEVWVKFKAHPLV